MLADREESSADLLNPLLDYHQAKLPHYAPLKSRIAFVRLPRRPRTQTATAGFVPQLRMTTPQKNTAFRLWDFNPWHKPSIMVDNLVFGYMEGFLSIRRSLLGEVLNMGYRGLLTTVAF
ncbi:unnamed protein product [Fusarium graminearum]|nr:unnamed protein product [Fusarium graminearum]VTO88625.1 unnamed protein product [Fusarium graminearum]